MELGTPLPTSVRPRTRPLRLVTPPPDDLGPISPELALVSPDLARAARERLPDPPWQLPAVEAARPAPGGARSGRDDPVPVRFDTAERDLGRHGMTLVRTLAGGIATWTLTLPRGERVETRAPSPGAVPAAIASTLRAVTADRRLEPVPWHADSREFAEVREQLAAQRSAILRHDPGTRLAEDPENLHQLRVALRRLRALLRVNRRVLDGRWVETIAAELGELGRAAGGVRDADVLLERLRREISDVDPGDTHAAARLLDLLDAERGRLQVDLLRALDGDRYRDLLERLGSPVPAAAAPPDGSVAARTARELGRLVHDVRALGREPGDDDLHRVRIRVKRARYALELGERGGAREEKVVREARDLQDLLGEHQDAVVLEARLRDAAARADDAAVAFVAGRLAERQRRRRRKLRRRLPRAWKALRRAARRAR